MADETLVPILASIASSAAEVRGVPRCVQPDRTQILRLPVDLDELVEPDHPARAIWAYVDGLDLTERTPASARWTALRDVRRPIRGCCWGCGCWLSLTGWAARGG